MKIINLGKALLALAVVLVPLYVAVKAVEAKPDAGSLKFKYQTKYASTIKSNIEETAPNAGRKGLVIEIDSPVAFHDSNVKCTVNAALSDVVRNGRVSGKINTLSCEGESRKFGHLQFTKPVTGYLLDENGRYGLPVDSGSGAKVAVVFHISRFAPQAL